MLKNDDLLFLRKFISIKTITGDQVRQKEAIDLIKKELPVLFKEISFCKKTYESRLFYSSSKKFFDIFFIVHVDVVTGEDRLFLLKEKGDRICGRGVFDMKGPIFSIIEALKNFFNENKRKLSVGLLVTSDEEIGGFNGTGFVLGRDNFDIKLAIVPDGGDKINSLITEEKGVLDLELSYKGKSVHVSNPWDGKNAAEILLEIIKKVKSRFPDGKSNDWQTVASLTEFKSELVAENVSPNFAKARIVFRYIKDDSSSEILSFLKSLDQRLKVKIIKQGGAIKIDPQNRQIKAYRQAVQSITKKTCILERCHSSCDAHFLSSRGIPVIISRPNGGDPHSKKEWISKKSMGDFSQILLEFLKKIEKMNN